MDMKISVFNWEYSFSIKNYTVLDFSENVDISELIFIRLAFELFNCVLRIKALW